MSVGCIGHLQHTIFKTMNEAVLEYMLDMDIDLACGNSFQCIILTTIRDKRYASVDRLLWYGANCNDVQVLTYAVSSAYPPVLQVLLYRCLHIDLYGLLPDNDTLIKKAARTGDLAMVKMLIQHGFTIDSTPPSWDQSALYEAVKNNHLDLVRYLLTKGAALHLHHPQGMT